MDPSEHTPIPTPHYVMILGPTPDIPQGGGGGVGVLPITTYNGGLYLKGAPFWGFRYTWLYESVGISLVEFYDKGLFWKSILVCNKAQKD